MESLPSEARACVTQLEMTLSRHNVVGGQRLTQPRDAVCPAVTSLATVTQTYIEILVLCHFSHFGSYIKYTVKLFCFIVFCEIHSKLKELKSSRLSKFSSKFIF